MSNKLTKGENIDSLDLTRIVILLGLWLGNIYYSQRGTKYLRLLWKRNIFWEEEKWVGFRKTFKPESQHFLD